MQSFVGARRSQPARLNTMQASQDPARQASTTPDSWSVPPVPLQDVAVENTGFRFFDLPRELRDMCYTLLYGERRDVRLVSRETFRTRESDRKREDRKSFKPAAFPQHSLSHLLAINKQFFVEAAMVWTASKVFVCGFGPDLMSCLNDTRSLDYQVLQHMTAVNFTLGLWSESVVDECVCRLPKLSRVTINLYPPCVQDDHEDGVGPMWEETYTDAELASFSYIQPLLRFRGLKSLTVSWSRCYAAETLEQKEVMERNKASVQALVSDVGTRVPESPIKRGKMVSFDQAMDAAINSWKIKPIAQPRSPTEGLSRDAGYTAPLMDDELPQTESDLVRLALSRPKATLKWMMDAKIAMAG